MSMCHDCPEGHYSSAGATSCIPPAPTGFLSNATATSVTVQWEAIAAVSFETTINGTNKERHIENSRTFDNLLPGSVYIVKVVAIGANGVESSATTESIETMPDGVNTLGIALGVSGGVGALVLLVVLIPICLLVVFVVCIVVARMKKSKASKASGPSSIEMMEI